MDNLIADLLQDKELIKIIKERLGTVANREINSPRKML